MTPACLAALTLLAPWVVQASDAGGARAVQLEPAVVRVDRDERAGGTELWTVRAARSSPAALIARLAELSGRELDATSALERAPLVSVVLDRRPLEQVLEYALGSAGLSGELTPRTIAVRAADSAAETDERLVGLAAAAWKRAAARFPRHPVAAGARLAQGELSEIAGEIDAARARYLDVLERAPSSREAGEAYLRAGRIAAQRGDWSEASEHYRALANLEDAEEYRALARLELARATLNLGDAAGALHILEALELAQPSWDATDAAARTLLNAEALLELQRFEDALVELETGLGALDALDPPAAAGAARLRARALEGSDLCEEAARAWLVVARGEQGATRIQAYRSAARLAAEARDDLGVLFVAREAEMAGFGAAVAAEERAARGRLGLEREEEPAAAPDVERRLALAEERLERNELERAAEELEPLYAKRALFELDHAVQARLVLGWARCLAQRADVESAVQLVAADRRRTSAPEFRKALDLGVARLLEERGLFERAADAYQGSY